jgi:hypothetical protein
MESYLSTARLEAEGYTNPNITLWHGLLTHLMAITISVFGNAAPFVWFQILCSIASLLLVADLAYRYLPPRACLCAVSLQAFDLLQVNFAGFYMGEVMAGTFLIASIRLLILWRQRDRGLIFLVTAGIMLGLAGMSREYVLLFAPPLIYWFMATCRGNIGRRAAHVVVFGLACFATLIPQLYLNLELVGTATLGTTRSARYFAYAWSQSSSHISASDGTAWNSPVFKKSQTFRPFSQEQIEIHLPGSLDTTYWRQVLRRETSHNPSMFALKLKHPLLAWVLPPWPTADEKGVQGTLLMLVHYSFLVVVLPLYLLQLGSGFKRERPELLLLNLSVLALFVVCFLGHGQASYRIPFQPEFILLASWQLGRIKKFAQTCLFSLGVVAAILLICWNPGKPPVPRTAPLFVEGNSSSTSGTKLALGQMDIAETGILPEEISEVLGAPLIEWSTAAYPHAWHYAWGAQRLRIDLNRQGEIEKFVLFPRESGDFLPPAQVWRWSETKLNEEAPSP